MRGLGDAGKSGSTAADVIIRVTVVEQVPQQIGKTERFSQHQIRHYRLQNVWPAHVSNMISCRRLRERTCSDCYAAYLSNIVKSDYSNAGLDQLGSALIRDAVFSEKSRFQLCSHDNLRRVWRRAWHRGDLALAITHTHSRALWSGVAFCLTAEPLW